jgi:hypothetical protein
MNIRQISIFLENKRGRLAEVTDVLRQEGINIRALSLADTADFGVLRIIVNDPAACLKVLKDHDIIAQATDVLAVEIEDRPGGLHRVLEACDRGGLNIEYMYAFVEKKQGNAIVIFKIDDLPRAIEALTRSGISLLSSNALAVL